MPCYWIVSSVLFSMNLLSNSRKSLLSTSLSASNRALTLTEILGVSGNNLSHKEISMRSMVNARLFGEKISLKTGICTAMWYFHIVLPLWDGTQGPKYLPLLAHVTNPSLIDNVMLKFHIPLRDAEILSSLSDSHSLERALQRRALCLNQQWYSYWE